MILQNIILLISGYKRVHQKDFHAGIKHVGQHSRFQIHLCQHHRMSDAGLLSNVISIRLLLCIFSNSRHIRTRDRCLCELGIVMLETIPPPDC